MECFNQFKLSHKYNLLFWLEWLEVEQLKLKIQDSQTLQPRELAMGGKFPHTKSVIKWWITILRDQKMLKQGPHSHHQ